MKSRTKGKEFRLMQIKTYHVPWILSTMLFSLLVLKQVELTVVANRNLGAGFENTVETLSILHKPKHNNVQLYGVATSVDQPEEKRERQKQDQQKVTSGWPALSDLVDEKTNKIKSQDVQLLLDFAVLGHSRTGTTSIAHWLSSHSEIQMPHHNVPYLHQGKPAEFAKEMYSLPAGSQYKRGYKSSSDILDAKVDRALVEFWPKTKLIVGLRHPILWFESLYNFRNREGLLLPPPKDLIGKCSKESHGVCTAHADFYQHFFRLEKSFMMPVANTNSSSQDNIRGNQIRKRQKFEMNPVFIYDIDQLADTDVERQEKFRMDVSKFLGLKTPLESFTKVPHTQAETHLIDSVIDTLDICHEEYKEVRTDLLNQGRQASMWIRKHFLKQPNVFVSSREFLELVLAKWGIDPCLERMGKNTNVK